MEIKVEKPTKEMIAKAKTWPIWEKEPSTFPYSYDSQEQFLVISGKATVTPQGGKAVSFAAGDFVTMPKGLRCSWTIKEKIVKHYNFG
jgi:uncharacterized cupin superfamily protein